MIFITGIVIGLLGGYMFFGGNGDVANTGIAEEKEVGESAKSDTESIIEGITVENQPAGNIVNVASAVLSQDAWVVIREKTDNGEPGNILGAQIFPSGTSEGEVTLLRNTVPDESYFAGIYTDDGDQEFEFKTEDKPVTDGLGDILLVEFHTYPTSPR